VGAQLVDELCAMGIELDADELQTTGSVAASALQGKRVLALTMHALVGDLDGLDLVGEGADAVLIGGADDTPETNLVFSYMNLARAFGELELGAQLYCLHRNRWWQTKRGPLLDGGAFVAGLEYAAQVEAVVLGKPSSAYFAAACEALDADPQMAWMVAGLRKQRLYSASAAGSKNESPCFVLASFFSMNQSGSKPIMRSGMSKGWMLKNQCQENVAHCLLM